MALLHLSHKIRPNDLRLSCATQALGLLPITPQFNPCKEEEDDLWRVTFMALDLAFYDAHEGVFQRGGS